MRADTAERPLNSQLMDAWKQAARELGIRVEIPFALKTETGGVEFYEGHILDLGGPKGTVFRPISNKAEPTSRKENGFFGPDLGPSYCQYNRQHFMSTLDDWKWFGPDGEQPDWYTGKNWS